MLWRLRLGSNPGKCKGGCNDKGRRTAAMRSFDRLLWTLIVGEVVRFWISADRCIGIHVTTRSRRHSELSELNWT